MLLCICEQVYRCIITYLVGRSQIMTHRLLLFAYNFLAKFKPRLGQLGELILLASVHVHGCWIHECLLDHRCMVKHGAISA
jgi:hypothetical protein